MAKKEELILVRGKWEIASIETNAATGKRQWERRDSSYICDDGAESERVSLPVNRLPRALAAKPKKGN